MRLRPFVVLLGLALAACQPAPAPPKPEAPPARLGLQPVGFETLPGWQADDQAAALPALRRSCAVFLKQAADRPLGEGRFGRIGDWHGPCRTLATLPDGDAAAARRFFEAEFRPYLANANGDPEGLFTGYYEPELRGSRTPGPAYPVPLLRKPADLVTVDLGAFRETLKGQRLSGRVDGGRLVPYEDRAAIAGGKLAGRAEPLLWVDDPIDAFFLEIQGSGRVTLPDGGVARVGVDGQNGHPYVAIGRELVARGALTKEEVSLQTIRAWLKANPAEAQAVMNKNPSYIFFREVPGEGPLGAQGVPLTPGRSLAVDRGHVPYGLPLWLDAAHPTEPARLQRLMVAQDTGGAIRGPVRGDVFWGFGAEAERLAGPMKSPGRYFLLLPRGVAPQL